MKRYNHRQVEKKWQKFWAAKKFFSARDFDARKKQYVLFEFPYPSGAGLHVGHLRPYVATDILARWKRMEGANVLYPIGWDAFGLPTENYAIKNKIHPRIATDRNIKTFRRQLKATGLSLDWNREVDTTDPEYYKWTQWIFLKLFEAGLAYRAEIPINWCPFEKTGLANEEVVNGRHERCGTPVEKKLMKQWVIKITKYADRLIEDLELVDYPERVKTQQINWIGKSEGADIVFPIVDTQIKRFVLLHGRQGSPQDIFFPWLAQKLLDRGYKVEIPELPNPDKPNDLEQAEHVRKHCRLDAQTVILGHSFGGVVALRLLERGAKAHSVVLAATPISGRFNDNTKRPTVTEAVKRGFDFEKVRKSADRFIVLMDETDSIIPASDGEKLAQALGAEYRFIPGKSPHFTGSQEPGIYEAVLPSLRVFTTRADTIFGATHLVVAPEHPIVGWYLSHHHAVSGVWNIKEVSEYVVVAKKKTDITRLAEEKEKTGIELKRFSVSHPLSGRKLPVWVADYVMMGYGSGAIMAVPAHDERDFAFAKKYKIPFLPVIKPTSVDARDDRPEPSAVGRADIDLVASCWTGEGMLINSEKYNGLPSERARQNITWDLEKIGLGSKSVSYKLRDWVFSRQHYWGEPIPIIHCPDCGEVPVPEKDLPVLLPNVKRYEPTDTGESPLAAIAKFVNVKCPRCRGPAKRETDTMPNWAGSNWYFIRYADPKNKKDFASRKKIDYWLPVDLYIGGMEHTTLHLLYSRFIYKFLYDQGLLAGSEPYSKRRSNGVILAEDGRKMSKSYGNVVNPDDIIGEFGADTMRMYEMFLAPFDQMVPWDSRGVKGVRRFLDRVWIDIKVMIKEKKGRRAQKTSSRQMSQAIRKITNDLGDLKFNTAISSLMIAFNGEGGRPDWRPKLNTEEKWEPVGGAESFDLAATEAFLKLLSPFAPHITEELWALLGHKESIQLERWPEYNESLLAKDTFKIPIQVNGKVRDVLEFAATAEQHEIETQALNSPKVEAHLKGKTIVRTIFVAGKMINFVVR